MSASVSAWISITACLTGAPTASRRKGVERIVGRRTDERLDHQLVGPAIELVDPQLSVGDRLDRGRQFAFGLLVCPLGLVQLGLLRGHVVLELEAPPGPRRPWPGGIDLRVDLRAL